MSRFPIMELQPTGLDHSRDANSTKASPQTPRRVAGAGAASRSPGFSQTFTRRRAARTHRLRSGRGFVPECEGQYFKLQIEKCKLKIEEDPPRRLPDTGGQP